MTVGGLKKVQRVKSPMALSFPSYNHYLIQKNKMACHFSHASFGIPDAMPKSSKDIAPLLEHVQNVFSSRWMLMWKNNMRVGGALRHSYRYARTHGLKFQYRSWSANLKNQFGISICRSSRSNALVTA